MGVGAQLSAGLGLDMALGEITQRLDKLIELGTRNTIGPNPPDGKVGGMPNPVRSPRVIKFSASKVASNTAYNFADVYGPPAGFVLDLRRLFVTGADPFTATTGNVFPFISAGVGLFADSATEPANFPEIISNDATTTIPYRDSWARGTALLLNKERLYLLFKSVPNATVLWIYGQGVLWHEDDAASWASL